MGWGNWKRLWTRCTIHMHEIFKELIVNFKNRIKIKTGENYINRIRQGKKWIVQTPGKVPSVEFLLYFSHGVMDNLPFLWVTTSSFECLLGLHHRKSRIGSGRLFRWQTQVSSPSNAQADIGRSKSSHDKPVYYCLVCLGPAKRETVRYK